MPRRFKYYEMGNGSLGRCTAEGAILEICMPLRMVMMQMRCGEGLSERRTEFHQKRRTAGRHEPDGDIGAENQRGQQYDGQHIRSPTLKMPGSHTRADNNARGRYIVPVAIRFPSKLLCELQEDAAARSILRGKFPDAIA